MGLEVAIAAVGVGLAGYGAYQQFQGQKAATAASVNAENLRKKQMNLEAERQRRQAIREGVVSRGQAVNNAANQGAEQSSALQGGVAQTTAQAATNITSINQSETIGNAIFDANADLAKAQGQIAMGQSFGDAGNKILNNIPAITRVGGFVTRQQTY